MNSLDLLDRAQEIAKRQLVVPLKTAMSDFEWIAAHHLVIAHQDSQAVKVLCREGLSDVALVLVRRIWEDAVRLSYIKQNPAERCRQFIEDAWVDAMVTFDLAAAQVRGGAASGVARALVSDPRFDAKIQELTALECQVSEEARQRARAKRIGPLWKISQMAREVGLANQYDFLYRFLSQRTHAGVDAVKDYFRIDVSGGLHTSRTDYGPMVLPLAGIWLLFISQVFAEVSGRQEEVAEIEGIFQDLQSGTKEPVEQIGEDL